MLHVIRTHYAEHFKVNKPYVEGRPSLFEFEVGCDYMIENSYSLEKQLEILDEDAAKFLEIRKPYMIYK
jgi:hypothetical protein